MRSVVVGFCLILALASSFTSAWAGILFGVFGLIAMCWRPGRRRPKRGEDSDGLDADGDDGLDGATPDLSDTADSANAGD